MDRQALGLVLQNIKAEFHLSDTQLGLMTGLAFAVFYSAMGIPIARWADRGNRVTIITLTTALWSVAVALCGAAANFAQLLACRVAVAVGEAGGVPPAHSLLADSFPRQDRARAVALYMLGGPLSVVIGFFAAGWVNQIYGWRTTFFVLGLPGIALALLARFTLKEPRRALVVPQPYTSFEDVCRTLWRNGTFRHLLLNFSVVAFFNYGITQWKPAFFIRSFGFETGQLGTWFAAIYGTCGLIGSLAGGEWASRRAANDERRQLTVMAAVICACGGISALMYLSTNRYVALGLMALLAVGGAAINGPLLATIQTLIPQRMRAMSIAVIYLFANLIGMGLGPVAAGALSDALRPRFGEESLRYALLAMCPGYLWAAAHIWSASKTVARDLKVAQAQDLP